MVPVLTWTDLVEMASKLIARHRTDADSSVMVSCELDEKESLVASEDPSFFTEPHHDGYGAILVRVETVDPAQLAELLTQAWWQRAPAKLRKQLERS